MVEQDLAGQIVFVTHAEVGVGRAVAEHAARRGAAVAVVSGSGWADPAVAELDGSGGHVAVLEGDVSVVDGVRRLVQQCAARLGSPTAVVHCPPAPAPTPLGEVGFDVWRATRAAILDAAWFLARETAPAMTRAGRGALVFLVPSSALYGLPAGSLPAAAASSALRGLVRSLSQEIARHGVTANVVAHSADPTGSAASHAAPSAAMGRTVTAEEVAVMVLGLVGPTGNIVTGETLMAAGGVYGFGD